MAIPLLIGAAAAVVGAVTAVAASSSSSSTSVETSDTGGEGRRRRAAVHKRTADEKRKEKEIVQASLVSQGRNLAETIQNSLEECVSIEFNGKPSLKINLASFNYLYFGKTPNYEIRSKFQNIEAHAGFSKNEIVNGLTKVSSVFNVARIRMNESLQLTESQLDQLDLNLEDIRSLKLRLQSSKDNLNK